MTVPPRPLHIGKFLPPPFAGVEAHIDTLLRSLASDLETGLVAGRSSSVHVAPATPYKVFEARSYGKLFSTTISPGVLRIAVEQLRRGDFNILHTHVPNPWADILCLNKAVSCPVAITWHSDIVKQKKLLRLYRPLQRKAIERADRIIVFTPSHYTSSAQLKIPGVEEKLAIIPIGIDFSSISAASSSMPSHSPFIEKINDFLAGRLMLLSVGRHVYYKGYEFLISAMKSVNPDVALVLVGTGVLTEKLRSQIAELGLSGRVLLLGEVSNNELSFALNRCDIFCLPSIEQSEAFGIATAEAMSCGKPAIVCELGNGVNYLNRHEQTGLTVPPRDPASLADAINSLARDSSARSRMGVFAKNWVTSEFSIESMKTKLIETYKKMLT